MKKLNSILMALAVTSTMMAAELSSLVQITLTPKSVTSPKDVVILSEGSQFTESTTDGDATKQKMNHDEYATNVDVYMILPSAGNFAMVATAEDKLNGKYIGVQASSEYTDYVFTFNVKAMGRKMCLEDLQEHKTILLTTETEPYAFSVTANAKVEDRFRICAFTEPTICHQYGNLIITGHVGDKVKVLKMDDSVAIAEQTIDTDSKVIELTSLTSGEQYQVVVGDKTMIIRVQ